MTDLGQRRPERRRGRTLGRILAYAGLLVATYAAAAGAAWWRYATAAGDPYRHGYVVAGAFLGGAVLLAGTAIGGYLLASRWWLAVAPLPTLVVGGLAGVALAGVGETVWWQYPLGVVLVMLLFSGLPASGMVVCGWIGIRLRSSRRARRDRRGGD